MRHLSPCGVRKRPVLIRPALRISKRGAHRQTGQRNLFRVSSRPLQNAPASATVAVGFSPAFSETKGPPVLILPAIDLRGGQCVRLRQGDYDQETVFGADPAAVARRWVDDGAEFLHLVDLDGARQGR